MGKKRLGTGGCGDPDTRIKGVERVKTRVAVCNRCASRTIAGG
jgi:hypothetical protein